MPLVVDEQMALANSRLTGIRLSMLTLRSMENWRRVVDDCEKSLVLLAIVAVTGERFTRNGILEQELRDLRALFPPERLPRCSVSSIAAATGFNRETTRRKVNELIDAGILSRAANGIIRFVPGLMQRDSISEVVRTQLDAGVRFANDLIRDGTLRME